MSTSEMSITGQESVEQMRELAETANRLGDIGLMTVIRLSVDQETMLRIRPSVPIRTQPSQDWGGRIGREFEGKPSYTSKPFTVISMIVAHPDYIPGKNNNVVAFDEGEYVIGACDQWLEQKAYCFNLNDGHQIDVIQVGKDTSIYTETCQNGGLTAEAESRLEFFWNGIYR